MFLFKLSLLAFFLLLSLSPVSGQPAGKRGLILISIDGLHPDYLLSADKYGLKIPNLRRIYRDGAHARNVRGVLPTVTYPSHTTMITGVWPVKHGIYNNVTFDPTGKNMGGWHWYSEDIRTPTLWESAAKAGYTIGSVSWPVSVSAPGVKYVIPEYWRAVTADDLKLVRALSTPGLLSEFQKDLGEYILDLDVAIPGDWMRTRYTEAIIRRKQADFVTLHLASLDHLEHSDGPFSAKAFESLEAIDAMVGVLEKALFDIRPDSAVAIVSDHGFAKTERQLNIVSAFAKAGLVTPNRNRTSLQAPAFSEWQAQVWPAGGSAAIILKDSNDASTPAKVRKLLQEIASDPANGIARILDRREIAKLGGDPTAEFVVDMKPGFYVGSAVDGPLVRETKPGGTHGHSPTHPEMSACFFMAGPSIKKADWGDVDMRSIAPTLALFLGVKLPAADLPHLDVLSNSP